MLNMRKLTCIIECENGEFIATNPELNIIGCGISEEEALANLKTSVEEHLKVSSTEETLEPLSYQLCITDI